MPARPLIADLADAVAEEIKSAAAFAAYDAAVAYAPVYDPEKLTALKITVMPAVRAVERMTRTARRNDYTIVCMVQQKLPTASTADIEKETVEAVLAVADELLDYLDSRPLTLLGTAKNLAIAQDPVFDPTHLRELRVVTSVVRVSYIIAE